MKLEYKGHVANLEVDYPKIEMFTTFAYDDYWDNNYTVTFKSPLIQCVSKPLNKKELKLVKEIYIKWWEQLIDKI